MPTKMLFWNIQNFTYNKINFKANKPVYIFQNGYSYIFTGTNTLKSEYILDNVKQTNPDVFVVIEVVSGRGDKGSLVSSVGAQGVLALAERMQTLSKEWCLVPPLKLTDKIQVHEIDGESDEEDSGLLELIREGGYTEAIAVFFRKDRLDFLGPNIWPTQTPKGHPEKISVPPGDGTPGAYPDEWQKYLPTNNYYAGQVTFKDKAEQEMLFPDVGSRRPFLTKFREKQGKKRLLTVASVHFPPNEGSARTALSKLGRYFEEHGIQNDELIVIAGDFNLDYLDKPHPLIFLKPYGFHCYLDAGEDGGPPTPPSMYRKITKATPDDYRPHLGLDNVAIRCGSLAAFEEVGVLVMNRVEKIVLAAEIPSLFYTPMDTILAEPNPAIRNMHFRAPYNFGRIGPNPGTSDHLAIYVEL